MLRATPTAPYSASPAPSDHADGPIGPNAVIQVAHVLRDRLGAEVAERLLHDATGLTLDTLPHDMVPASMARALMLQVVATVGEARASTLLREAGTRTGDYLLANRIPPLARRVLPFLPRRLALAVLLRAMRAHAWTFAGSGRFTAWRDPAGVVLGIAHCPLCDGVHASRARCDFFAATFERLVRVLVDARWHVHEERCAAQGGTQCRFRLVGS